MNEWWWWQNNNGMNVLSICFGKGFWINVPIVLRWYCEIVSPGYNCFYMIDIPVIDIPMIVSCRLCCEASSEANVTSYLLVEWKGSFMLPIMLIITISDACVFIQRTGLSKRLKFWDWKRQSRTTFSSTFSNIVCPRDNIVSCKPVATTSSLVGCSAAVYSGENFRINRKPQMPKGPPLWV